MAEYIEKMKPLIEEIFDDFRIEEENHIMRAVAEVGICVDKPRLVKALTDAKAFYEEGYRAAINAEVRHGEWVGERNMRLNLPQLSAYDDWHCSECDWVYPESYIGRLSKYCPNCGAKMDGKGEGE